MSIIIIYILFNAIILAMARYTVVQQNVMNYPFYSYILWHILLFTILSILFYESKHGFKKTINIFTWLFYIFKRTGRKNALESTISRYRAKSEKVYLSRVFIAVAITISVALVLYSELIFFSVVVSDSMNPTLHRGDLILMQNLIVKPEIGDIVAAKVPDMQLPVMHRVVSISGDTLRTKGDGNPAEDSWIIAKSQILGKNVYISGRPVIIGKLGEYFIVDASGGGRTYGPEFNAISTLIRGVKAAGLLIFIVCLILYLVVSIRAARRTRL